MQKGIALATCMAIVMGLFTGCGNKNDQQIAASPDEVQNKSSEQSFITSCANILKISHNITLVLNKKQQSATKPHPFITEGWFLPHSGKLFDTSLSLN